jgi:hypothetical protein
MLVRSLNSQKSFTPSLMEREGEDAKYGETRKRNFVFFENSFSTP